MRANTGHKLNVHSVFDMKTHNTVLCSFLIRGCTVVGELSRKCLSSFG